MDRNLYIIGIIALVMLVLIQPAQAIFIGGSTWLTNDTFEANFTYDYNNYPYVPINTTIRIDFIYDYNGTPITDGEVFFDLLNTTQANLSFSYSYNSYPIFLSFSSGEEGTYYWTANANKTGFRNDNLTGKLIVSDYSFVKVKMWQDCKWYQVWCSDQTRYKNRFGYIFATPIPKEKMAYLNYSWANQLQPLKEFGIWGERVLGNNVSKLYVLPNPSFAGIYKGGEALLFLPSNQTYALSFMAANFFLENEDGLGKAYYSKKYTENLFLDVIDVQPDIYYMPEYYVTNYELHRSQVWTFWILFGVIAMIGLIIIGFLMAFSPTHGLIALLVYFLLLPIIWLALKLIFWVVTL